MKILDRYIIVTFLKNLIWAIIAATVIFIVVNGVERLDKFVDAKVQLSTVIRYYYLYIPYIFYLILPAAALLATLFTIGGMTMTNELVAIKVSGISFYRPLMLLLLTTGAWAFAAYVLGETVIPPFNREHEDIYRYDVKKLPREYRAKHGRIYVKIGAERQLYINNYKTLTREAFGIKILDVDNGRVIKHIDAEKMVWRDNTWFIDGATERVFDIDRNRCHPSAGDSSTNVSVTWRRNVDLTISGDGLRPDEFERVKTKPEELNGRELKEFIDRLKSTGGKTMRWDVELLAKASQPVAAVIIVLFGAPIAAVRRRSGTAIGFGISLFICFIYFGFIQVGKILGINGTLPPWLGAWIGNIFFGILGLGLLFKRSSY